MTPNRKIVLTAAGVAAVYFGWDQVTRHSARRPIEEPRHRLKSEEVGELSKKPEAIHLKVRSERVDDWKVQWELQRKQDKERQFFEWRDGKLGAPPASISASLNG